MFDVGFQELVIIFLVALVVFGPKRLPEVGRTLGKWIGDLRKGIYDAKMQMESEFDEIRKEHPEEGSEKTAAGEAIPEKQDAVQDGGVVHEAEDGDKNGDKR
jgi:Tat protein translocase TatB subunit